jgi:hypothetical protein
MRNSGFVQVRPIRVGALWRFVLPLAHSWDQLSIQPMDFRLNTSAESQSEGRRDRDSLEVGTYLEPLMETDEQSTRRREDQRLYERLEAPPCRPLSARLEGETPDAPPSQWFSADILDISLGGVCVLITGTPDMHLGQRMTLDFKAHRLPESLQPQTLIAARLRWFVRSGLVSTLGISFDSPLPELPELLAERRQQRRDPNSL